VALRAGFIGLGNIGKPMARRLVAAGLETSVLDAVQAPVDELVREGAKPARSSRELAERADVIGVCVRDDADVRAVIGGDDGLLAGAARGSVIAIHSTILPSTVREVGAAAAERGVGLLDACVTGGAAIAAAGKLTYMVGGDAAWLERCRPVFETSAARIVHTGPLGTGAATKLCNNLMTYLAWLSAFESLQLARAAGLSQEKLEEVTRSNGNLTEPMQAFLAVHKAPEETRRSAGFQAMLRGFVTLAEKDLAVTLAFARESGVALPGTGLVSQLMARVYGLDDAARR
jgi:3-hydroxyisobutyrate dehydrogenase-like beta-hydroxyacid dehydrogenase